MCPHSIIPTDQGQSAWLLFNDINFFGKCFFLVYDFKYTAFLSKSHTFQVLLFCLLLWILIINLAKNI